MKGDGCMLKIFQETLISARNKFDFKEKVEIFSNSNYKKNLEVKDYRKAIRNGYKKSGATNNLVKQLEKLYNHKYLVNHGTVYGKWQDGTKDTDSWTDWYLVKTESNDKVLSEMQAEKFLYHYLKDIVNFDDEPIYSDYDCTGRVFSYAMEFKKVGKNLVLATKRYGVDV